MTSPFAILQNAQITFTRTWDEVEDPNTGNLVPSIPDQLIATAYFKKMRAAYDEKTGSDTSTFSISGYVVEPNPLPDWCRNARGDCACWIKGVGQGVFRWEPKLLVVKDLLESITGTIVQGTFVLKGGFNETHPQR